MMGRSLTSASMWVWRVWKVTRVVSVGDDAAAEKVIWGFVRLILRL